MCAFNRARRTRTTRRRADGLTRNRPPRPESCFFGGRFLVSLSSRRPRAAYALTTEETRSCAKRRHDGCRAWRGADPATQAPAFRVFGRRRIRAAFCGISLRGFVRRHSPPPAGISRSPEQARLRRAPTIRGENPKSRKPETPGERRGGVQTPPRATGSPGRNLTNQL